MLGTHVAGIVAANATEINQTGFIPFQPFIGVAPQVTLGACKLQRYLTINRLSNKKII